MDKVGVDNEKLLTQGTLRKLLEKWEESNWVTNSVQVRC